MWLFRYFRVSTRIFPAASWFDQFDLLLISRRTTLVIGFCSGLRVHVLLQTVQFEILSPTSLEYVAVAFAENVNTFVVKFNGSV